jgi:NADH dehydrogenase (ubiquinone) 1 beta subcomplex subunit 9
MRLYRRALKLQMSWTPRYDVFRGEAMEIRRRFEANMHVTDPRQLSKLVQDAENELYRHRHPDPYIRISPPNTFYCLGAIEWLTRDV